MKLQTQVENIVPNQLFSLYVDLKLNLEELDDEVGYVDKILPAVFGIKHGLLSDLEEKWS